MADNGARKQRGRPWPKGVSGNPAGKPKGTRHKATMAAQALLDGEAEALTRRAIEMALDGDIAALRLVLERLVPPRRDAPLAIDLPPVVTAADAATAMSQLVAAVSAGTITPAEAQAVAGLIEQHRRTLETTELERRIAELEAAQQQGSSNRWPPA